MKATQIKGNYHATQVLESDGFNRATIHQCEALMNFAENMMNEFPDDASATLSNMLNMFDPRFTEKVLNIDVFSKVTERTSGRHNREFKVFCYTLLWNDRMHSISFIGEDVTDTKCLSHSCWEHATKYEHLVEYDGTIMFKEV